MMSESRPVSKNPKALGVCGLRPSGCQAIDQPCELHYHCPVCKYPISTPKDGYDERLNWSEYETMIWCEKCNRDYPSCLCCGSDVQTAIDVYLDSVQHLIDLKLKRTSMLLRE